jgi:hypothetical protein
MLFLNMVCLTVASPPAILSVVDFARQISGFNILNQEDQVTLLKVSIKLWVIR